MGSHETPEIVPIPEPPALPLIGHIREISPTFPLGSFVSMAEKYGEIYKLRLPGRTAVMVSSVALVDEICDEKRFQKNPSGPLEQVRNGVNDGLFTARPDEPRWGVAHRVLMPAFGPVSIRAMFDDMHDIAMQLTMKWARHGSRHAIGVSDDFTRLALDTLALCSMGYRFNSYYTNEMHPFVEAMGDFLTQSGARATRPPLPGWWYTNEDAKYEQDIETMRQTADEVLQARKTGGEARKDLLQAMLEGVDSKTGQRMDDQSIVDNLITFLIAGHETTSGLLSFTFYNLLKNPEAYRKAQEEVDQVVGKGPITIDHLSKLRYIPAALRETLRLSSPITIFAVEAIQDTIMGGKYEIKKGDKVSALLAKSHHDPAVYGDDAEQYKPERMMDEPFNKLPRNAWKPFGNGMRACIGRPFAWQESLLTMTMLLQNFTFVLDDPNYNMRLKQTLTIKPEGFFMRAIPRDGLTVTEMEQRLAGKPISSDKGHGHVASHQNVDRANQQKMTILYGSNSGTCEALAQRIASDAVGHGFTADVVDCMDVANGKLPKDQPVVVITASYEGQPPDNAAHFVSWLENIKDNKALEGVRYAVFGCGHSDWAQTFHRIPKLVDGKLEEAGAKRVVPIGLSNAADGDIFSDFERWEDEDFWPALSSEWNTTDISKDTPQVGNLEVTVSNMRVASLRQDVQEAIVTNTHVLTAEGEPVKKHIELKLPSDLSYRSGDYIAVLPFNPKDSIRRVMRRFNLPWDSYLTIKATGKTSLPTNLPMSAYEVFAVYVELAQPATKRNIAAISAAAGDDSIKAALQRLSTSEEGASSAHRPSVLDLLEKYPSVDLPLGSFMAMLPPMRVRQYSISSSPVADPKRATITFSLLDTPSNTRPGKHVGVASSYLNLIERGDKVHVAIRPSHAAFHLPSDQESTPVICVSAGTGLAPFRGFMQERAALKAAGRQLAPALLVHGCRAPGRDDLYADELAEWEAAGVVRVRRAFSRKSEASSTPGCAYAQDQLLADGDEVGKMWADGARLYVCGSRAVGQGVRDSIVRIKLAAEKRHNGVEMTEAEALAWWEGERNVRYATDVFD